MSSVERPVVELLRNAVGQSGEEGARTAAVHHRGVEVGWQCGTGHRQVLVSAESPVEFQSRKCHTDPVLYSIP